MSSRSVNLPFQSSPNHPSNNINDNIGNNEIEITIKAKLISYDSSTNSYCIKIPNARFLTDQTADKSIIINLHNNTIKGEIKNNASLPPPPPPPSLPSKSKSYSKSNPKSRSRSRSNSNSNSKPKPALNLQVNDIDNILNEIDIKEQENEKKEILENISINLSMPQIFDDILAKWELLLTSSSHSSSSISNKCNIRECSSMYRIYFILHYYQLYILNKSINYSTHYVISNFNDFISSSLSSYSYIAMINDWQHIYNVHLMHKTDKKLKKIKKFINELNEGKCSSSYCAIYKRHYLMNKYDSPSNNIYYSQSPNEICLSQRLDTIHCSLFHSISNVLNCDKYITTILYEKKELNKFKNGSSISMTKYSFGHSSDLINYWDKKNNKYNKKYNNLYSELLNNKIYAISLNIFNIISYNASQYLLTHSGKLMISLREGIATTCDLMKKCRIKIATQITLNHIIALLTYLNISSLQSNFKNLCFRTSSISSKKEVITCHREISNWSSLLFECVHIYGKSFSKSKKYYHSLNCKLLLNRFQNMFFLPTSLTSSKEIASSFCPRSGITLELAHGGIGDISSLGLNVELLSDNPMEKEMLIYHSFTLCTDIIINRKRHNIWLQMLKLWFKIKNGFFFAHLVKHRCSKGKRGRGRGRSRGSIGAYSKLNGSNNIRRKSISRQSFGSHYTDDNDDDNNNKHRNKERSGLITRNDQLWICSMIQNMILSSSSNYNKDKYDDRVPHYIQMLFNESIKNKSIFWLIESEYYCLIQQLRKLLHFHNIHHDNDNDDTSSQFIKYLCDYKQCNIRRVDTFEWNLCATDIADLLLAQHFWITSPQYKLFCNNNNILIHFEAQNKPNNGLFRIKLCIDKYPININQINIGMGLICDKLKFDNYSFAQIKITKPYNSSLHSLFKTDQLDQFKNVQIKFQIQLCNLFDPNGKNIHIQQP